MVPTATLVIVMIVELILVMGLMFLVMDACKCKKHSKGVLFRTTQYVRQISAGYRDNYAATSTKRTRNDTGSVSFLYDVNDQNANKTYNNPAIV